VERVEDYVVRKRRTPQELRNLVPSNVREHVHWRYAAGDSVRDIARALSLPGDLVSDVLEHSLGKDFTRGRRSKAELAAQPAARARLASLPPLVSPPPPSVPDIVCRNEDQRMRWARHFYLGPCSPSFADCRGHSLAEVARSLQMRPERAVGLLDGLGVKPRTAGGRRRGPGHPLPRLLTSQTKGAAQ
jgi:hypothetical protein